MIKKVFFTFLIILFSTIDPIYSSTFQINGHEITGNFSSNNFVINTREGIVVNYPEITGSKFFNHMGAKGRNTKIIVMDDALSSRHHLNLASTAVCGRPDYDDGVRGAHGTAVSNIVHNICPETIISFKTISGISDNDFIDNLSSYSRNEADIISMSFSWKDFFDKNRKKFLSALQNVTDSGKIIFKSIGNDQNSDTSYIAELLYTVSQKRFKNRIVLVAGTQYDENGTESLYRFSNYPLNEHYENGGNSLVLSAPAQNIPSIDVNGNFLLKNGTSFACPMVASSFLSLKSFLLRCGGAYSNDDILNALKNNARSVLNHNGTVDYRLGNGVVSLKDTIFSLAKTDKIVKDSLLEGYKRYKMIIRLENELAQRREIAALKKEIHLKKEVARLKREIEKEKLAKKHK